MREQDEIRFEAYVKRRRGWKLWQKIVGSLICVVVFCTTYALILPAITEETDTFCGYEEHIHEDSCYQIAETAPPELICQLEETAVHVHEEACYLPAHTHGEECYAAEQILVCETEETEAHVHGAECYGTETPLICGQEASEGHTHAETCYEETVSAACGLEESEAHAHGDGCYAETASSLTCTLAETEGHTHSDACHTASGGELVCGQEESADHTHETTCYSETVTTLTCSLEEAEAHIHSDTCYTTTGGELTCTLAESEGHTHTEACNGETAKTLVCALEESAGHTHDETCNGEAVETLVCTLEETEGHTHGETCYTAGEPVLVCELEERVEAELICTTEETEGHTHSEECYASSEATVPAEGVLVCELEEHTHDLTCHSNPNADIENASDWESTFADVELSGVWADDLLAIAESQLGYQESTKNYIVLEDGETTKGYTRYGAWYGDPYGDWCAMFVSFCMHYAQVPEEAIPQHHNCAQWIETLSGENWNLYTPAEGYTPVPGDLIFFDQDGDGVSNHVGIVKELTDEGLTTIEGNSGNRVKNNTYAPDDTTILGYGMLPVYEEPVPEPTTRTVAIYTDSTFETPSDDATVITVTGIIPEDAQIKAYPVTVESELKVLCAYDISIILSDGTVFEPAEGETLDVHIQSSVLNDTEDELKVYYIPDEGEPEAIDTTVTDEGVEFGADHFSTYAVMAVDTGDFQVEVDVDLVADSNDPAYDTITYEAKDYSAYGYETLWSYQITVKRGNQYYVGPYDGTEPMTVTITSDAFIGQEGIEVRRVNVWNASDYQILDTTVGTNSVTFHTTPADVKDKIIAIIVPMKPLSGTAATADELYDMINSGAPSATITLGADITLSDQMTISQEVNLDLNGYTITCANSDPLFMINTGGTLNLKDSQATGETTEKTSLDPLGAHEASVSDTGSGVTLTYYVTKSDVSNSSTGATTETVYKHTVTASGAIKAGSGTVFQLSGGTLNMESGMIYGGTGRAIYASDWNNTSTVNLSGGYICGFTNSSNGAAVSLTNGSLDISGSTVIAANHSDSFGGAIALDSATLDFTGGIISGNTVSSTSHSTGVSGSGLDTGLVRGGAGIYANNATINMSGGYVTNNNAYPTGYWGGGGGIWLQSNTTLNLTGGYITGNEACGGGGIKTADCQGGNVIKMNGGYICSNLATYSEGGGINIGIDGTGYINAGFINNNHADCWIDWGGGGVFIANGSYLYMTNALITDNSAGGFGGGIAGCSTARMHISVTEGAGVHANQASGTNTSGSGSTKNEDWIYAKNSSVFMENGYQDIFSALNCTVEGGMLGGGVANWSGSCDGVPVTSDRAEDLIQSQNVLGLTAYPTDYAVSAAQAAAAVYLNGNSAYTHGGGILCNGYLVLGTPQEIIIGARIELTAEKIYLDGEGSDQPMTSGQFTFVIKEIGSDDSETVVSTGTSDTAGVITFDGRLPFSHDGVYTYHIHELAGSDSSIAYDSALYRMTVTVERNVTTNPNGLSNVTTYQCFVEDVLIEKWNPETNSWDTYTESFNPGDSDNSPIRLDLGENTFVNKVREGTMDLTVHKVWDCPEYAVLDSVTVQLLQNGAAYGDTVTLSEENGWTHTWTELPLSGGSGTSCSYEVEEIVPASFEASYAYIADADSTTVTITNTLKTYQLDITKVSDDPTPVSLPGAVFQLMDSGKTALSFVQAEDTGIYSLSDASAEDATMELVTGADGKLILSGLPSGTYTLSETDAPSGYALATSVTVTLDDSTEDLDEHGVLPMTIVDAAMNYLLPETGGTGMIPYATAGLLMMLSSGILLSRSTSRRKEDVSE